MGIRPFLVMRWLIIGIKLSLPSHNMEIKLIVLGNYSVGKTSILQKFKSDRFGEQTGSTIAIDYISQVFDIKGKDVKVQFWDTAGQEKFSNITEQYYRKAQGSIIVVSCENTVEKNIGECEKYLSLCKEQNQRLPSILLFNKLDLVGGQYVQEMNKHLKQLKDLQGKYSLTDFKVVSAKTNCSQDFANIFEPFVREIASTALISSIETDKTVQSRLQPSVIDNREKEGCC